MWFLVGGILLPFGVEAQVASQGLKLGNLTLRPYLGLEYDYDSNIIFSHNEYGDSIIRINPGLDLKYQGNDWGVLANAWYSHAWYTKYDVKDYDRWGERVSIYRESAKGWKLTAGQGYTESDQNDSLQLDGGDGVWRNRLQFDANAALSYTFNERLAATISTHFTDMWYGNSSTDYLNLYGWMNWSVGLEVAHRLTERSSLVLSGAYQEYYSGESLFGSNIKKSQDDWRFSNKSEGYSLMGGIASRLTERVRYRALVGASLYDYAGEQSYAPSYSLDATWVVNNKFALTAAGAGYYQPSERSYYQRKTIYSLSAGATYRPLKRVQFTLDGIYRGEDNETVDRYSNYAVNYMRNQYTARLRGSYQLQKYVSVYASAEYTIQEIDHSNYSKDDWNRYLLTVGLMLRY